MLPTEINGSAPRIDVNPDPRPANIAESNRRLTGGDDLARLCIPAEYHAANRSGECQIANRGTYSREIRLRTGNLSPCARDLLRPAALTQQKEGLPRGIAPSCCLSGRPFGGVPLLKWNRAFLRQWRECARGPPQSLSLPPAQRRNSASARLISAARAPFSASRNPASRA